MAFSAITVFYFIFMILHFKIYFSSLKILNKFGIPLQYMFDIHVSHNPQNIETRTPTT